MSQRPKRGRPGVGSDTMAQSTQGNATQGHNDQDPKPADIMAIITNNLRTTGRTVWASYLVALLLPGQVLLLLQLITNVNECLLHPVLVSDDSATDEEELSLGGQASKAIEALLSGGVYDRR